jgi:hypothetical protein
VFDGKAINRAEFCSWYINYEKHAVTEQWQVFIELQAESVLIA